MGAHALGAAAYAVRAADLAAPERADTVAAETAWHVARMSAEVGEALARLPEVGTDPSGPLGPGLLASGPAGRIVRELQLSIAGVAR